MLIHLILLVLILNSLASITRNISVLVEASRLPNDLQPVEPCSPYLPPTLKTFILDLKKSFQEHFPENPEPKRQVGRPRLPRLPFFLTWAWNRLWFKGIPKEALELVNKDPVLQEMFEIPVNGLKKTTYETFTSQELTTYLPALIATNVKELVTKGILTAETLAGDDFPIGSVLNLSKAIDFPKPKKEEVQKFFQELPALDWVNETTGSKANKHRGWSDYLRIFLFYLLWGFPSQKSFDVFVRNNPHLTAWLCLHKKVVLFGTFIKYISQLQVKICAEEVFQQLLRLVVKTASVRAKLQSVAQIHELGQLFGLFGNNHRVKDYGAKLHYNSSKGKYYLGRIGRIIVDTWTQIPLWIEVVTSNQILSQDLKALGEKVTSLLQDLVDPLVVLFDSGFRGTEREKILQDSFSTTCKIIITPPYNRSKPTINIFRIERISVERSIGHLTVHLDLESPQQLGTTATIGWVLGAVFLIQRIALYNHEYFPGTAPTAITHLQKRR